jgi:hypothetical protein
MKFIRAPTPHQSMFSTYIRTGYGYVSKSSWASRRSRCGRRRTGGSSHTDVRTKASIQRCAFKHRIPFLQSLLVEQSSQSFLREVVGAVGLEGGFPEQCSDVVPHQPTTETTSRHTHESHWTLANDNWTESWTGGAISPVNSMCHQHKLLGFNCHRRQQKCSSNKKHGERSFCSCPWSFDIKI